MSGLVPLREVWDLVLPACPPLAPRTLPLTDALGRVLAADAVATATVPPFDNSAMDGYAVVAADCAGATTTLVVTESVMAGGRADGVVGAGQAVRIMTGAPLPPGADAVVPVERTVAGDGTVNLEGPVGVGDHVRRAGGDVVPGDLVVRAGTVLRPAHLGLLATAGLDDVRCHPAPVVGVLSTGDELLPGASSGIVDSNRIALLATLTADGVPNVDLGVVPDDEQQLVAVLEEAAGRCDAVLTTGGVSVGDRDIVRAVLGRVPTTTHRWLQVAIKPAKPFAFAVVDRGADRPGLPVFGLPGNPVSALVSAELFARPALRRMAGHGRWWRPQIKALSSVDFTRHPDGKLHLVPSVADLGGDGTMTVAPASPRQGSHLLTSIAPANALAFVPDGDGVPAGTPLDVWLLDADDAVGPR
ncbi:MAG: molybdopterin molybdotransferase MoeA [Acidimicrobiales bacterium]